MRYIRLVLDIAMCSLAGVDQAFIIYLLSDFLACLHQVYF
jgi:hypothetical protein